MVGVRPTCSMSISRPPQARLAALLTRYGYLCPELAAESSRKQANNRGRWSLVLLCSRTAGPLGDAGRGLATVVVRNRRLLALSAVSAAAFEGRSPTLVISLRGALLGAGLSASGPRRFGDNRMGRFLAPTTRAQLCIVIEVELSSGQLG